MDFLTIVGCILAIVFIPFVGVSYWFLKSIAIDHMTEIGFFKLVVFAFTALVSLLVSAMSIGKTFFALQEGLIRCIDTSRGHSQDCTASFELSINPIEFWSTLFIQYLLAVGFMVLAISCIRVIFINTIRKP